MLEKISKYFTLSEKGLKDLLKAVGWGLLYYASIMLSVSYIIYFLMCAIPYAINGTGSIPSIPLLIISAIVILGLIGILFYKKYYYDYITTYTESGERRIRLAEKLRKLPLSYFGKKNLSDLTSAIMSDCTELEHAFSHAYPGFLVAVLLIVIMGIGLICYNWKMGIALVWVVPVAYLVIFGLKFVQVKFADKSLLAKRDLASQLQEDLENIRDIKSMNLEEKFYKKTEEKIDNVEKSAIKSEITLAPFIFTAQSLVKFGIVSVIIVGSFLLVRNEIDLFTFIMYLVAATRFYEPVILSFENIAEIYSSLPKIRRMREIEEYPTLQGKEKPNFSSYDIEFKDVSFSYQKNEEVLSNINVEIKQGEVTAFVGPSGSGKSTLTKLIARFWDPNKGKIMIGGKDISKIDSEKILENISIVFQDVVLFNDTILENIRIGNRNASDEEVIKASKLAQCDSFIKELPNGYNTVIGENGSTLSGGERQRISIARAILKNAPIILLDEATASLDAENETEIQEAISKLVKNKTVLIIAHRMRTVTNADKIIVLKDGKVQEEGKPEELLNKNTMFKDMVQKQQESLNWNLS